MLRFGILGCARICRRGMIEGIQTSGHSRLSAIASRRPGQAAAWANEFSIPRSFDDYQSLIDHPEIDAVYLPLANEEHKTWTLRAAAAGKHVLCEKPLALNVADAEEMVSACRRAGVMLMEAFMWRHHPRVEKARELLRTGRLGELRLIKMDFSFTIAPDDWRLDPARGGGALFDLGCYGINMSRLFTGSEPNEIYARARMSQSGVDLTDAITLRFPCEAQALLDCSFESIDRNRIELIGTQGTLEFPQGVLPVGTSELILRTAQGEERFRFESIRQYAEQVAAFCRGIAAGKLPDPVEDGLANMRVLDATKRIAWANTISR